MSTILSPKAVRLLAAALLTVLLAGVSASCSEGGMYQGGGDSAPSWRR
jgi:hypothetical protein